MWIMKLKENLQLIKAFPRIQGIYLIIYHKTNKVYIGQSRNIRQRILNHLKGKGNKLLWKDIQNYKEIDFTLIILEENKSRVNRELRESDYIKIWNSLEPFGYNRMP